MVQREPELEQVFADMSEFEDLHSPFQDEKAIIRLLEHIVPRPLRSFLDDVERGTAKPWEAEHPVFLATRHWDKANERLASGEGNEFGRVIVRFLLHPAAPTLVERMMIALAKRSERRVRESPHARLLLRWIVALADSHPTARPVVLNAVWDLDVPQRNNAPKLLAALEPLDGADDLREELAVRRLLSVYHQLAELAYRPYCATLWSMARACDPALPKRADFGGVVIELRRYLESTWVDCIGLADPDVVFLRNAAAHTGCEPVFENRRYRLRNTTRGGKEVVREYTARQLSAQLKRLLLVVLPEAGIQRVAECIRNRLVVRHLLRDEVEKLRSGIEENRATLTRYANGEDVDGIFERSP